MKCVYLHVVVSFEANWEKCSTCSLVLLIYFLERLLQFGTISFLQCSLQSFTNIAMPFYQSRILAQSCVIHGKLSSCNSPDLFPDVKLVGLPDTSVSASVIDVDKFVNVNIYQILLAYTSLYTPILQIKSMCTNLFLLLLLLLFTLPWEVIFLEIAIINVYNWRIQIVDTNC